MTQIPIIMLQLGQVLVSASLQVQHVTHTGGKQDAVNGGSAASPREGWESVGGLSHVVQQLKEMVLLPLLYPDLFTSMGVAPPR